MIDWHKFPNEVPGKEGSYLVMSSLDEIDDVKYANVSTLEWWQKGHFVETEDSLVMTRHYRELYHHMPATKDDWMNRTFNEPMGYHVSHDGFYDLNADEVGRCVCCNKTVIAWAELPELPEGYQDQNAYMDAM